MDDDRLIKAQNLKREIQHIEYCLTRIDEKRLLSIKIVWKNPDDRASYSELDDMPPEMLGMYRDLLKRKLKILKEEYEQI
jgi:hypothetical protein